MKRNEDRMKNNANQPIGYKAMLLSAWTSVFALQHNQTHPSIPIGYKAMLLSACSWSSASALQQYR
jgi:hypothetical protein